MNYNTQQHDDYINLHSAGSLAHSRLFSEIWCQVKTASVIVTDSSDPLMNLNISLPAAPKPPAPLDGTQSSPPHNCNLPGAEITLNVLLQFLL